MEGILFEGGNFKNIVDIDLFETEENMDWIKFLYQNNYYEFFEIGDAEFFTMSCYFYTGSEKSKPKYIIEICDMNGGHEYFFITTFIDLNLFLKEMKPIVDMAKHIELNKGVND